MSDQQPTSRRSVTIAGLTGTDENAKRLPFRLAALNLSAAWPVPLCAVVPGAARAFDSIVKLEEAEQALIAVTGRADAAELFAAEIAEATKRAVYRYANDLTNDWPAEAGIRDVIDQVCVGTLQAPNRKDAT